MIPEEKKASEKMISVKVACDKGGFPNTSYLTCFGALSQRIKIPWNRRRLRNALNFHRNDQQDYFLSKIGAKIVSRLRPFQLVAELCGKLGDKSSRHTKARMMQNQ